MASEYNSTILLTVLQWILTIILTLLGLTGCATTKADFTAVIETQYGPDGEVIGTTDTTHFIQKNLVTYGSKLNEGAGEMSYMWGEKGDGKMAVGNAASGLQAGDANQMISELVKALVSQMSMLQLSQQTTAPSETSNLPAVDLTQLTLQGLLKK